MGKVIARLSMSLDGFIAGPNDGLENPLGDGGQHLFKWYSSGDTELKWPNGAMTSRVSAVSAAHLQDMMATVGALLTGRKTFDIAHAWGGKHPLDVPVVVMTHAAPREWAEKESVFTFVSEGVVSAVARANQLAGSNNVAVGTANVAQQCLKAGLLDEIHIDLAPVLLGGGIRLFEHLGIEPIELERTQAVEAPGVTHLRFRVVK